MIVEIIIIMTRLHDGNHIIIAIRHYDSKNITIIIVLRSGSCDEGLTLLFTKIIKALSQSLRKGIANNFDISLEHIG